MTLVSQIITDAYREHNIIAIGDATTSGESTEALRLLNRYIMSLLGNGLGENLVQVNYGTTNVHDTAYDQASEVDTLFVEPNTRLICNLSTAKTVYLHPQPRDGARFGVVDVASNFSTYNLTVNGNGRDVEAASSVTLSTASLAREWFYRADTGNWVRVADLLVGDTVPFPQEYDDLLIIGLALRINPRHGRTISAESMLTYKTLMRSFKARYTQSRQSTVEMGLLNMTSNIDNNWGLHYFL